MWFRLPLTDGMQINDNRDECGGDCSLLLLLLFLDHRDDYEHSGSGIARGRIKIHTHRKKQVGEHLSIIGDVNDVISGIVPDGASRKWYPAQDFLVGLGAASPAHMKSLGEAFMFNGMEYTLSTDPEERYFETIVGKKYLTTFSIGLNKRATPDITMQFLAKQSAKTPCPEKNFEMHDMYLHLNKELGGGPFCYYGLVRFKRLRSISVSKAPIYGENIFEQRDKYYSQPALDLSNILTVTAGCAANFSNIDDDNLRKQLSRALYVNPLDEASDRELNVHSHAISIRREFAKDKFADDLDLHDVTPDMVEGVYHMLSNSEIDKLTVHAFRINGIKDVTNL